MTLLKRLFSVNLSLLVGLATPQPGLMGQKGDLRTKKKSVKATVPYPFTIERLLGALRDVKHGDYTEPALIKRVIKDGVAFVSTSENVAILREAGASNALIGMVKNVAPPPVPIPVPVAKPDPRGDLELSCEPAECEVAINGSPLRKTIGGRLQAQALPQGEVLVKISKEGFLTAEAKLHVSANKANPLRIELKPTRETQQSWGEQLQKRAVAALGGQEGLRLMREILADGECTIWGQDGKPYQSSIRVLLRRSSKAFFRTQAGKAGFYEVDYQPVFKSRTNFPEQQARALDAGLRLVNGFQVGSLLERMQSTPVILIAESAAPDGHAFRAESSTETLTVLLDRDGRPKEVDQETSLGKGVRAEYSDYQLQKGSYTPMRMLVVWPGSPQQGISIQFHKVELAPPRNLDARNAVKKSRRLW